MKDYQYYVFEGLDRVGKTTLMKKVAERLRSQGKEVLVVNEPSNLNNMLSTIRQLIVTDGLSAEAKIYLAIAQRVELYKNTILPALKKGIIVLSDRNFLTSCLYQETDTHSPYYILGTNLTALDKFEGSGIPTALIYLSISHDEFLDRINRDGDIVDIEVPLLDPRIYNERQQKYLSVIKEFRNICPVKYLPYVNFEQLIKEIN